MRKNLWSWRSGVTLFGLCASLCAAEADSQPSARLGSLPPPPSKEGYSVESLLASGVRGGRLYPVGTNFTAAANREMGEAMEVWNARRWREGNAMFDRIYRQDPDSPWAAEAELHVAAFNRLNGHYPESEERFLSVLAQHGDKSDGIKQRVLLHLPQLYWETGRPRVALACLRLMTETELDWPRRQFLENWSRILDNAIKQEDKDRKCGAVAVALALEALGRGNADQPLANMTMRSLVAKHPWANAESRHPDGYSLAELAALSGGSPRQIDFATLQRVARPGSPVVACLEPPDEPKFFERMKRTPSGDYKRPPGHFVVVESVTDKLVTILDPRFGRLRQELNRFTFTWKGKILVLPGQDLRLGESLSAAEAAAARGGCCGSPTPADSLDDLCDTGSNEKCTNVKGAGGQAQGSPQGAPSYQFGLPNANLNVADIPLWLPPARGPAMAVRLDQNRTDSRNGAEYTNVNYYCFGNKWSFNYASVYREAPSENATVFLPKGRHEEYYKTADGVYVAKSARNKNKLEIVGGEAKLTVDLDKSVYFFSTNTEWLTRMEDRHGNAVICRHDTVTGWLTNVTDSAGRSLAFKYNNQGFVTNIVDNLGRSSSFAYANGDIVAMTDMGGYQTKLSYDTNHWVSSIVYPQGLTNAFSYANGSELGNPYDRYESRGYPAFRIRSIDSLNHTNEYFYHAFAGMGPVTVKDSAGDSWLYGHDGNVPYSFVDSDSVNESPDDTYTRRGDQWGRRVYDADGVSLSEIHYANSASTTILGNGNYGAYVTDHFSRYFTYDTNGWLIGERWATNGMTCAVWSNRYDNVGNLVSRRDPLANVTAFAYNNTRDVIAITNALSQTVKIGYNSDGTVAAVTNARGYVTRFQYDTRGFNTNIVFPDNTAIGMTFDVVGRLTRFRDTAGDQANLAYDKLDRPTNVLFSSDATCMRYAYSFSGVTNITDRLGRATAFGRDAVGRVTSVTDARGDRIGLAYGPKNQIKRIDMPMGLHANSLKFEYASANGFSRLARTLSPRGRIDSYSYTFRGWLASHTDPKGVATVFTHDALGRLVGVSYGGGSEIGLRYDALNRITRMTDPLATNAFAYDAIGQATSITVAVSVPGFSSVAYRLAYAYDAAGNLTNRVLLGTAGFTNEIREALAYDNMDRLTLLSNVYARAEYAYDSAGRLATKTYGNGDVTTCGYGSESRLASLVTSNAGTLVQGWSYQYNVMGAITNIAGGGTNWAFTYDSVDQLTQEKYGLTNVSAWTYDSLGNRLTTSNDTGAVWYSYNGDNEMTHYSQTTNDWIVVRGAVAPGPRSNKWYDSWANWQDRTSHVSPTNGMFELAAVPLASGANALTVTVTDVSGNTSTQAVTVTNLSVFGVSPTYDANGNLTALVQAGVTRTFEWDAANQLTSAADNGVEVLRCWYDGAGRRIAKSEVVNGQTNKFQYVYEGMTIIAVLDETGALLEYYTRGLGVGGDIGTIVAATHTTNSWTNGTFYVHNNHRGDVTAVRAGTTTVATYDYSAFGETRSASGTYTPRFRFSSKELDAANGFYYFGFRFYEPVTGRWLSNDPIGISGGLNLYVFCANNPLNFVDPFGLWNIWNSGTWGVPNGGDVSAWHSLNPFDETAAVGATLWGYSKGAAATLDGINPFGDPLQSAYADECGNVSDVYDLSRKLGGFSRDVYLMKVFNQLGMDKLHYSNPRGAGRFPHINMFGEHVRIPKVLVDVFRKKVRFGKWPF